MSNRHYPVKETDIRKLNSKLLSISYAKDEGDWTNILHTHHFTELLLVVDGKGSFLFGTEKPPHQAGRSGHHSTLHGTHGAVFQRYAP